VEVRYRGKRMDYEDLAVRPPIVQAAAGEARRELAKQVGSKPAQDHPWRQGYEQRMKLQRLSIASVITPWGVRLRCALSAPHTAAQGLHSGEHPKDNSKSKEKGSFLKRLDTMSRIRLT
jgi:hypothetical protein